MPVHERVRHKKKEKRYADIKQKDIRHALKSYYIHRHRHTQRATTYRHVCIDIYIQTHKEGGETCCGARVHGPGTAERRQADIHIDT